MNRTTKDTNTWAAAWCALALCAAAGAEADEDAGAASEAAAASAEQQVETAQPDSDAVEEVPMIEDTVVVNRTATGEEIRCRYRAPTGSRIKRTFCVTTEQRQQQETRVRRFFRGEVDPF